MCVYTVNISVISHLEQFCVPLGALRLAFESPVESAFSLLQQEQQQQLMGLFHECRDGGLAGRAKSKAQHRVLRKHCK